MGLTGLVHFTVTQARLLRLLPSVHKLWCKVKKNTIKIRFKRFCKRQSVFLFIFFFYSWP